QRQTGERGQWRRLEDDGVAGGQSGAQFHDIERVRKVPWRQNRHHTEWLVAQQGFTRGPVSVDLFLNRMAGEFCGVQRRERRSFDVDNSLVAGTAPFELRQREKLVGMLEQRRAELVEPTRPLLRS